ncbi:uncharacterized protein LOC117786243 [Drosophila innubila]|uniref:uncharacterized protein LOC117786243 n=1 Tax=Drosophila innubila TaxID=198719 RepID=UPI00148DF085|nr:uncharacterized protein LOC117786243 [Drosophila innubila]
MGIENNPTIKERAELPADEEIDLQNRIKKIKVMVIEHKKTDKDRKEEPTKDILVETTTTEEETGCLIDVLHLQMLQLIEEQISQQLALETHTSRARLILARTRLQQGTFRTAATTHLPGSQPYRALCRVVEQGVSWGSNLNLRRFGVDPSRGFLEPVTHIFGSLVPYSLRLASRVWERCVDEIVECVNVQRELQSVVRCIERLKWARYRRRNV